MQDKTPTSQKPLPRQPQKQLQKAQSVVDYDDYRNYLKDVLQEKTRRNPTFSLRAFARLVGMSPSHLSRTLGGTKRLSVAAARQLSAALGHSAQEAEHFLGLVEYDFASDETERSRILKRLTLTQKTGWKVLSLETFRVIADWYHFALLALVGTRGFTADSHWIARRLGIKAIDAKRAFERLLQLGLLQKTAKGYSASNDADFSTTDDVASAAINENHRQHLELATNALADPNLELREFNNLTLSMNLSDIPKAKRMIRAFVDEFNSEMETVPGQEVFALNVQFHKLSKGEDA